MTLVQEAVRGERTWAMLAHLLTFSGLVVPFGNLVAPVVVGLVKRRSAYVRYHARSAFTFQVGFLLYEAVALLAALAAMKGRWNAFLVAFVGLFALVVLIGWVVLVLHAAIRARSGVCCSYPFVPRFLR